MLLLTTLLLAGCVEDGTVGPDPEETGSPETPDPGPALVWPLSGTAGPDADSVHSPYGPRWIGEYDFHAGIDLPARTGHDVRAAMAGTVAQVRIWDGSSTGAGNAILIHHADGRSTSYLHLDAVQVTEHSSVEAGQVIGTVGRTGASYPHLHFGYMLNLPRDAVDERRSRNPLELLEHDAPGSVPVAFVDDASVRLTVPLQGMTIRSVTLSGPGLEHTADYYDIVALGSGPRNAEVHDGVRIGVERPAGGVFPLTLGVDADARVDRVVVVDVHGDTIADATRSP